MAGRPVLSRVLVSLAISACSGRHQPPTPQQREDGGVMQQPKDADMSNDSRSQSTSRPDDPRLDAVRRYEDAFCAQATSLVDQMRALRRSLANLSARDLAARAEELLRSDQDWAKAHPAPDGLLPPARPGAFLHPSGLQPSPQMYYCGWSKARLLVRLQAVVDGEPGTALDGAKGEPKDPDEYVDEVVKRFKERNPDWRP